MSSPLPPFDAWLVARLAGGRLPRALVPWARRRVEARPALREAYVALREAERAAAGSPDVTRAQSESIEAGLFDALTELQESAAPAPHRATLVWSTALVAAAIALVVVTDRGSSGADDDVTTVRGDSAGVLGVTVRCVLRGQNDDVRQLGSVSAGPGVPGGTLRCPSDAVLVFAFTNTRRDAVHAAVVGVSDDDQLRYYAPFLKGGRALEVPAGAIDELSPVAAELAGMPHGERVGLRAVFTAEPVGVEQLGRAIEHLERRGLSPSRLERLPLGGLEGRVEQARLDVEILPPGGGG